MIPPSLLHQLSQQQQAQRNAALGQQASGGLGQALICDSRGLQAFTADRGQPVKKNLTFKEELQDEIDQWLKDI